nr:hypothetical protein [Halosegnis rubeus]
MPVVARHHSGGRAEDGEERARGESPTRERPGDRLCREDEPRREQVIGDQPDSESDEVTAEDAARLARVGVGTHGEHVRRRAETREDER